jgi:hypothetical protein
MNHDDYLKEIEQFASSLEEDDPERRYTNSQSAEYIRSLLGRLEAAERTVRNLYATNNYLVRTDLIAYLLSMQDSDDRAFTRADEIESRKAPC